MQQNPLRIERVQKTLKELALERMREAIVNLHFEPGERLVERSLCDQLGVSRSVVREVLRHLESEGLVESTPHHGPSVAVLDRETAEQIYEVRAHLEAIGARAFAEQASELELQRLKRDMAVLEDSLIQGTPETLLGAITAFYETMFLCSGKAVAWAILQPLNARINSLRRMTMLSDGRAQQSMQEMRAIMAAITARDPDRAEAACRDHVRKAAEVANSVFDSREKTG